VLYGRIIFLVARLQSASLREMQKGEKREIEERNKMLQEGGAQTFSMTTEYCGKAS